MKSVENVRPYGGTKPKGEEVEEMFDSIAPAYDFMNNAMTFGLCRWWRNRALKLAARALEGKRVTDVLDVATGTGDVALELTRRFPAARVTGVDLSAGMLKVAADKASALPDDLRHRVSFCQGDSLNLKWADASFDLVTVAYGVRNFADLQRGLTEMARVLRPGGVLCVVELSEPANALTRSLYRFYSRKIIPALGSMVSGDKSAYTYLPQSIAACPQREGMTALMSRAGLAGCRWKSLTFGAVTLYYGKKGL